MMQGNHLNYYQLNQNKHMYKILLSILLLIIGNNTFSQKYPTTKYLDNGDHVVIMTVEQGRNINSRFVLLTDSIGKLNDTIRRKNIDINFLTRQVNTKETLLRYNSDSLSTATKELVFYKNEMRRIEKLEWFDKKTRKKVYWTVGGLGLVWGSFVYLLIKN